MNRFILSLTLTFALSNPLPAASTSDEIEHLLNFVSDSGCIFERNGSNYDSVDAREHIRRKYDHLKGRISNTEDFIRHAASQSSISGRQYHATCKGHTISSQDWLTRELKRYRQQAG